MQTPKSNGQSRFAEFLAECGGLGYVAVFKPLLASMMKDPHLPAIAKVLAWLKYYAWGNQTAVPVRYPGGLPLNQQDCAQDIGASPQMVSVAFRQLETDNYILRKGPFFALNPNPKPNVGIIPASRKRTTTNPAFEAHFEIIHAAEIEQARQAEETLKNFRLLRLHERNNWDKTHNSESNATGVESTAIGLESSATGFAAAQNGASNPMPLDHESSATGFPQAPILICDKKEKEERRVYTPTVVDTSTASTNQRPPNGVCTPPLGQNGAAPQPPKAVATHPHKPEEKSKPLNGNGVQDLFAVYWELFIRAGKALCDRDKEAALRIWLNFNLAEQEKIIFWTAEQMRDRWSDEKHTPLPANNLKTEGWKRVAETRSLRGPEAASERRIKELLIASMAARGYK